MDDNLLIARPYAKAVFAIAEATNKLSNWSELLATLASIAKDHRVKGLLIDPRVDWLQRATLFADICSPILDSLDKQGENFLQILAMNRRLYLLPEIAEFYAKLLAKQQDIVKTKIVSALPLAKQQQDKLQQALGERLQIQIEPQYETDASLIGGIIIRIGDRVIDGSIRGKLEKLEKYLRG